MKEIKFKPRQLSFLVECYDNYIKPTEEEYKRVGLEEYFGWCIETHPEDTGKISTYEGNSFYDYQLLLNNENNEIIATALGGYYLRNEHQFEDVITFTINNNIDVVSEINNVIAKLTDLTLITNGQTNVYINKAIDFLTDARYEKDRSLRGQQ